MIAEGSSDQIQRAVKKTRAEGFLSRKEHRSFEV